LTEEIVRHPKEALEKGLVSIFTGQGKGKTTAAIGTAVRAAGHGLKVYILFFMKGKKYVHGEFKALSEMPNITLKYFGQRSWACGTETLPEHKETAQQVLADVRKAMKAGQYDLIVLDEANIAIHNGLIELDDIVSFIDHKPENVEIIITGRNANPALVRMADLVSEILMIKHPFNEGVTARRGIDY
jgi:cob(I)alamin adenosyltransferase